MRLWITLSVFVACYLDSKAQCPTFGLTAEGQNLSNWTVSSSYNSEDKELYVSGFFDQEVLAIGGSSIDAIAFDTYLLYDLYLMKMTPDLQVDWMKQTGKSFSTPTSSRLCVTDGGVLAAFQFVDTVTFDSQQFIIEGSGFRENALFMKFGHQGDVEWIYRLTEVGTSQINAIDVGSDGMIYIVGTYTEELNLQGQLLVASDPQITDGEMFIAKFEQDGNLIWLKHLGGGEANDLAYSLSCGTNGIFVAGFFEGNLNIGSSTFTSPVPFQDGFVALVDTAGSVVWSVQLDGSISVRNEEVIPFEGGCVVSGHFRGSLEVGLQEGNSLLINSTTSVSDLFALRLDNSGNPLWLRNLGGDDAEAMLRLEAVNDELFMVSGLSKASFTVDGLTYTNHTSTPGNDNGIVLLLDGTGSVQCLSEVPSTNGSSAMVEYLGGDTIALVGGFVEDLFIQNLSLNVDGTSSVVVKQCFGCDELIMLDVPTIGKHQNQFEVYPNPTATQTKLTYGTPQGKPTLQVADMLGRVVQAVQLPSHEGTYTLDASTLGAGVYFCTLLSGAEVVATQKLVVSASHK